MRSESCENYKVTTGKGSALSARNIGHSMPGISESSKKIKKDKKKAKKESLFSGKSANSGTGTNNKLTAPSMAEEAEEGVIIDDSYNNN